MELMLVKVQHEHLDNEHLAASQAKLEEIKAGCVESRLRTGGKFEFPLVATLTTVQKQKFTDWATATYPEWVVTIET